MTDEPKLLTEDDLTRLEAPAGGLSTAESCRLVALRGLDAGLAREVKA